jgi:hypothetical protein
MFDDELEQLARQSPFAKFEFLGEDLLRLVAEVRRLRILEKRLIQARIIGGASTVGEEAFRILFERAEDRVMAAERLAEIVDRYETEIGCGNFYGELGPALAAYRKATGRK